jgi:hypothetical protein
MSLIGSSGYEPIYLGGVETDELKATTLITDAFTFTGDLVVNNLTAATTIDVVGGVAAGTVNTGQGDNELFLMDQDVQTTDAVSFPTINTGQGDNELYAMDQNVRTSDNVTFLTIDTGQGANELYAMDQDVQTTDAVTFATVNTGQGDNELYVMDQNMRTTDAVEFASVNTGQGDNDLYLMDQNVRTTDAVTFVTINTGQGDNNLYAMDQNVRTTDAVTFASVDTGQGANELYAMDQNVRTTDTVRMADLNTTNVTINSSGDAAAILAVESTTKGVLFTRQDTSGREGISAVTGLLTYDTDIDTLYLYTGSNWFPFHTPKSKGAALLTFIQFTVSSTTTITTQYRGDEFLQNIELDGTTGEITLRPRSVYLFIANFRGSFPSTDLVYFRILNDAGTVIDRAAPMGRFGNTSAWSARPTVMVDTNLTSDNEIVRLQFTHNSANYVISTGTEVHVMEL